MTDHWSKLKQDVGEPGKGKGLSRGARLAKESTKQREREIFLAGGRAMCLFFGLVCQHEDPDRVRSCGQQGAELHHVQKRSHGKGYDHDTGEMGVDDPKNLQWLCRKHHREAESNPMWTKETTDAYHEEMQRLRETDAD